MPNRAQRAANKVFREAKNAAKAKAAAATRPIAAEMV